MIILDATTRSLEIDLNAVVTTNQLPFVASYVDINQSTFAMSGMSSNTGTSNSTTAVTLVAAPGATTSRVLKYLSIKNSDTVSTLLWIQMNDNATLREIWKGTLAVGDTLVYVDSLGFNVVDSSGGIKSSLVNTMSTLTLTSTLTMSGTAANIALGSNFISNGGTDAGLSLDGSNNATLSGNLTLTGATLSTGSTTALSLATSGGTQAQVINVASAVNYLILVGAITTGNPILGARGSDTNISFQYDTKGSGGHRFTTAETSATQVLISHTASATRYITLTGSNGGNPVEDVSGGYLRHPGGVILGADSTNNLIDDASTGAGTATLYIGNASINVTSDESVKENVRLWDGDASALLRDLPVKAWDRYLSDAPMGGYEGGYVGFTAQDLRKAAPWAVNTQGDTGLPWQARYEFLNGIIVKGWQDHESRLAALEARVLQ